MERSIMWTTSLHQHGGKIFKVLITAKISPQKIGFTKSTIKSAYLTIDNAKNNFQMVPLFFYFHGLFEIAWQIVWHISNLYNRKQNIVKSETFVKDCSTEIPIPC